MSTLLTEPIPRPISCFNETKVKNVVKILRGDNNTTDNCTHLAKDMMEYFKTGIIPKSPSSINQSTSVDFDVTVETDWIKKETGTKYLGIVRSVVCLNNTTFSDIPCNMEIVRTPNGTYDIDADPIYDIDRSTQYSASVNEINDILKMKAKENKEEISFGFINIGRCGKYIDEPGHMLVYFATIMNVWYVDCQLYNGTKKKDMGCCFSDLTATYGFANRKRININVFGENIFFIPIGPRVIVSDNNIDMHPLFIKQENGFIESLVSVKQKNPITSCDNKIRKKTYKCEHGRQKSQCKDCKGGSICEHKHIRSTCKDCKGGSICKHDCRRSICKVCKGGSICKHERERSKCKDCKGGSICEHGHIRSTCKDCKGGSICEHDHIRSTCKDCKSSTKRKRNNSDDIFASSKKSKIV